MRGEDIAAYAHWTGELVAFFRFLAREGFTHAPACLRILERIGPEHEARYAALVAEACSKIRIR